MANGRALVTVNSPASERGKALGFTSMAFHVGYITGPTLGGFIIDAAGWRWVFFLTVPIGLACAYFGWKILKERPISDEKVAVDFAGAAYLLLTNLCFLYALNRLPHRGAQDSLVVIFFIVAAVTLFLFIRTEQKAPMPILSLSLFRNRLFTAANLSLFFLTSTQAAVSVLIPFYLQNLMGFTPTQMGWILIGGSVVIVVLAPVAGRMSDRFGSRTLCTIGAAIMIFGQYLIGSLTLQSSIIQMVVPQLLIGLGWALFNSPNQSAIMSTVPRDKVGAASGMTLTTARIGGAMGIAISGAVMTYALGANGLAPEQIELPASWAAAPEVFLKSFSFTVHWINALAIFSVIFAAMRGPRKD
jgi:EmrB/QacA subfamily drug resistance transporter